VNREMADIAPDVPGADSLRTLCERACDKSGEAFEAIFYLEQSRLAKMSEQRLRGAANAPIREEVLQNTWLAIWNRVCQLAGLLSDAEIRSYMNGVLRNLIRRVLKKKYQAAGVSSLDFDPLDEWSLAATHNYCGYNAEDICNTVARLLTREDRDVLELRRLGTTLPEISKQLEMSRSLVLSSYRRIKNTIQETATSLGIDLKIDGGKSDSK